MYHPLDHLFLIVFAVLWPLYALLYEFPRLKRDVAAGKPNARLTVYRKGMALEWVLAGTLLVGWLVAGRPTEWLGLQVPGGWRLLAGIGAVAIAVIFGTAQRRQVLGDEEARANMLENMSSIRAMLPTDRREVRHFYFLSVAAGVCEEFLYRGYLIWYLEQMTGMAGAVSVSSLAFGLAHAYQGWKGIVQTTIVGLVFALLYVMTESLIVPMLVHTFIDINSGALAYELLRSRDSQAAPEEASGPGGSTSSR